MSGRSAVGRRAWLTTLLAFLMIAPWIVYVAAAISASHSVRTNTVLQRNLATARLCARLVDMAGERASSLTDLAALRDRSSFTPSRGGVADPTRAVRDMVRIYPGLLCTAVCDAHGTLIAAYPGRFPQPPRATRAQWTRVAAPSEQAIPCDVLRSIRQREPPVLVVATALRRSTGPLTFLLAYWRMDGNATFPSTLRSRADGFVSLVSPTGAVLSAWTDAPAGQPDWRRTALIRRTRARGSGSFVLPRGSQNTDTLVSYSTSRAPRLHVLVWQPMGAREDSTGELVWRLSLLSLPVIALMALGARHIANLYRRQEAFAEQVEAQNARLREMNQSKSELLDNVSHDLWTPLATIELSITGLLDKRVPWTHGQIEEHLGLANAEVEKLIGRVRNLLEMARLEGQTPAQKVPCDLADLIGSALERLKVLLQSRLLEVEYGPQPLLFLGRPDQIEVVIMNLIENAVKYSPPGSPLRIRGETRDGDVLFALRDEGPGVDPGKMDRIFEKFQRDQPNTPMGGAGLGLAICKKVVEGHGGLIGVVNGAGGGAEFWFTLPAMKSRRG